MATKAALRIVLLLVASLGVHKQALAQDHIALGPVHRHPQRPVEVPHRG